MYKKMDNKAQGSNMLLLLLMMFIMFFVFTQPGIQAAMISFGNAVF